MRLQTSLLFLFAAPLLLALANSSGQKETAAAEPRYDTTNVDAIMVVADVKEITEGPLMGMHLMVRPETARANSETTDVFLAPDEYLKNFECHFAKGDRIQVKGSKVRFNGGQMVLAREVRLQTTTLYLRDDQGTPYWKKS